MSNYGGRGRDAASDAAELKVDQAFTLTVHNHEPRAETAASPQPPLHVWTGLAR